MSRAIRASRVLVSVSAEIIHNGVVIVDGERISKVGSWNDLKELHGAEHIEDLGDVTLMPGLFDCHVGI